MYIKFIQQQRIRIKILIIKQKNYTMTVKERLKQFIESKGISIREFCRRCELSSSYVSNMRNSISEKMLDKIAIQYPELNRAWLLLGEGTMTTLETDNSTLQNGCITIPAEAWAVIKQQAASLESRDNQINELIEMLKQQLPVHIPSQRLVCG